MSDTVDMAPGRTAFPGLRLRISTALIAAGIRSIEQLEALTERQITMLPGLGRKTAREIGDWIEQRRRA